MSGLPTPPSFDEHVGSAIDPIPASPLRKRAMREELLAHLLGAYEQELADGKSPGAALAAAKTRFGNLKNVREELRQSVPLLERLIFQFLTPTEPHMIRWILVAMACFAIGMALILPALAKIRAGERFTAEALIPFSIGVAIAVIGVALGGYRVIKISRQKTVTQR